MGEPVDDSFGLHRRAGGVDRGRSGTSAVGYPGHPADRRIRVQAGHFIGTDDLLRLPVSLYRPAYRGDRHYGEGDQERAFGELRIMN